MEVHTYSVAELGEHIAGVLDQAFYDGVWVQGEISGLNRSRNGHVYFDLIEPTDDVGRASTARLSVSLFRTARDVVNRLLKRAGGIRMTDGMQVRLSGMVSFHPGTGRLSLRMTSIDPSFTLGQLAAQRDQLVRTLSAEGLLDRNGRVPMPLVPLRVGLVTSHGSAAFADFTRELEQSSFAWQLTVIDSQVQGSGAEDAIVAAIATLTRRELDVIALVRGGGARGDLVVFDSERIARCIAHCRHPVLTGIGHEIDESVADRVAHAALKTPTACAAALVQHAEGFLRRVNEAAVALEATTSGHLARCESRLSDYAGRSVRRARQALDHAAVVHDDRAAAVGHLALRALQRSDQRLDGHRSVLSDTTPRLVRSHERWLDGLAAQVRAHDPVRTMARGWSITRTADGTVLRDIAEVRAGDQVVTSLAGGALRSTVDEVDTDVPGGID